MPIGLVSQDAIARGDGAARGPRDGDRGPPVIHQAPRREEHRLADRRHALHRRPPLLRTAPSSRISSRSGNSSRAPCTPAPGARRRSTTRSAPRCATRTAARQSRARTWPRVSGCSSSAASISTGDGVMTVTLKDVGDQDLVVGADRSRRRRALRNQVRATALTTAVIPWRCIAAIGCDASNPESRGEAERLTSGFTRARSRSARPMTRAPD